MVKDCANELRKYNVSYMSYWPDVVKTELFEAELKQKNENQSSIVNFNPWVRNLSFHIIYNNNYFSYSTVQPKIYKQYTLYTF